MLNAHELISVLVTIGILSGMAGNVDSALARGGEVSGGADSFTIAPAFFLSSDPNKTVGLCYEVSSAFGVPSAEVENDLRWAFSQWANYIDAKDLHYAARPGSAAIVGKLGDVHLGCRGDEDLRVYLGVENREVKNYRPRFLNPYAFSAIVSHSPDGRWSKGLLWVAGPRTVIPSKGIPVWNKSSPVQYGALKYVLLHEIGHIFGNGHVDDTVMTSRIGQWLENWASSAGYGPLEKDLRIDQDVELVPNLNLSASYKVPVEFGCVTIGGFDTCPDTQALAKSFERLFGSKPVGQLSATAMRLENPARQPHTRPDDVTTGAGELRLEFTDAQGTHVAKVVTIERISQKDESTPLFNGQYGEHYRSFGSSFSGFIETELKKRIPVVVNYNMGNLLTVVEFSVGGLKHPLLTSE